MLTSTPQVSVIIMTLNRPLALQRCLQSLTTQSIGGRAFEVILVDASKPPARDVVAAFANRLLIRHEIVENRGVARNRNIGASAAAAPLLACIDDDCVADPRWLEELMQMTERFPNKMIGGSVANLLPGNPVAIAGQLITNAVDRQFNPDPLNAYFVFGLNFAVPRQMFLRLGGNDEAFGLLAAEDKEFCARWRSMGLGIVKAPKAVVAHGHRSDLIGFLRQYYKYGRGAWKYHVMCSQTYSAYSEDLVTSHLGLLRQMSRQLTSCPWRMRPTVLALFLGWEAANTAGFLREAIGRSSLMQLLRRPAATPGEKQG